MLTRSNLSFNTLVLSPFLLLRFPFLSSVVFAERGTPPPRRGILPLGPSLTPALFYAKKASVTVPFFFQTFLNPTSQYALLIAFSVFSVETLKESMRFLLAAFSQTFFFSLLSFNYVSWRSHLRK